MTSAFVVEMDTGELHVDPTLDSPIYLASDLSYSLSILSEVNETFLNLTVAISYALTIERDIFLQSRIHMPIVFT